MSDIDDMAIIQTALDRMRSRGTQVSQADLAKLAEYPGLVDRMKAAERGYDALRETVETLEKQVLRLRAECDEAQKEVSRLEGYADALAAKRDHWMAVAKDMKEQVDALKADVEARDQALHDIWKRSKEYAAL